jgi:uncharacterized membrane protein YccC
MSSRSFARLLWQDVTRFDRSQFSAEVALRNSIGVVAPLALATWMGLPFAGLAGSLGALNVAFSDGTDSYASRAGRMLMSAICVALSVFGGSITGRSSLLVITIASIWSLAGGLMVVVGPQAAQVGIVSVILFIVFAGQPSDVTQSLSHALWALGGGLLQIPLASWPWRSHSFHAGILAKAFHKLAAHTRDGLKSQETIPAANQMTEANRTLTGISSNFTPTIQIYRSMLNQGERIRLELVALRDIHRQLVSALDDKAGYDRVTDVVLAAADVLDQAANSLTDDGAPSKAQTVLARFEQSARALRETFADTTNGLESAAVAHVLALSGQIRALTNLEDFGSFSGTSLEEPAPVPALSFWFDWYSETLRANLSLRSAGMRHAIRLAACVLVAEIVACATHSRFGFWIPMTAAIVLKPDFTGTFSRGLARFIGTFVGLLVAAALMYFVFGMKLVCIALTGIFMFAMRSAGRANYAIMVGSITALIVILLSLIGAPPSRTVIVRGEETLVGGALALLSYALWPTWESKLTPIALAELCDALKSYFYAVMMAYTASGSQTQIALSGRRLAARLARANAEASVERLYGEPLRSDADLGVAVRLLASSRRLGLATMALEAGAYHDRPIETAVSALRVFSDDVEATLQALSEKLRGAPSSIDRLPNLRADQIALKGAADHNGTLIVSQSDQITNAVNTMAELTDKLRL